MLENDKPEARAFLPQLEKAQVTPYRYPCGCASFDLSIDGHADPSCGMEILADFLFGIDNDLSGIFVFAPSGVLAGLEVYD
jgi:hypothetical protein